LVGARSNPEGILATTLKRRSTILDLPLATMLESRGPAPVHASLRAAIVGGRLPARSRLPSTRDLSRQLGVRRNVIVSAYEQLLVDGLVETRVGDGTYVASRLPPPPVARAATPRVQIDTPSRSAFALGQTYVDPVLLRRLATMTRRRVALAMPADVGYGDPRGSEALRSAVALYLRASRGVLCDPECVLIVSGTQQGVRLCADALLEPGDRVWVEDPGYRVTQRTLLAAHMRLIPVPVDAAGLDVVRGRKVARSAKAAYVTPTHQFPTGVTMTMERRVALLDWAREAKAWVLEDDYDSEFRYDGPPLTALAGIDGSDRVIYIGTFTKTLFAGLRLAYAVVPRAVLDRIVAARAAHDRFPPCFMERAVSDLMADGTLAAHVRRMRTRYRIARDMTAQALARAASGALRIRVPTQGLHMVAYLPPGLPKGAGAQIRANADVQAWLLSEARIQHSRVDGFILGFAGHDVHELTAAASRLGNATRTFVSKKA
jgi:GntR family transcriptional regulator/MocR family aminotransferase